MTLLAIPVPGDLLLTILNPTPEPVDEFGFSLATTPTGNLFVGARFDKTDASDAGSAYLFDGTTGGLLLTIPNPTPTVSDQFGYSVATTPTGNLLVGALFGDDGATNAGAAYLFDGTTGDLLLTLLHPTPEDDDFFGISVATTPSGDLLVGAMRDDTGAEEAGAAYLFDGTTGSLLLTIPNPTPEANDLFGASVATAPTGNLLVGALFGDDGATDAGAAYLFDGTTGDFLFTLQNPTPATGDFFGSSLATTPTGNLLVGANFDSTGAHGAGEAYLFDGTTGGLLFTIPNPTPAINDTFGFSVATTPSGDLLVGGVLDSTDANRSGAAYLFDGTTGGLLFTIPNPTPDADDTFGISVPLPRLVPF